MLPAKPVRQSAGAVVRERLRNAEDHDDGQHRGASGELKFLFGDRRQDAAFHPDHRANEGVDDDEQVNCRAFARRPRRTVPALDSMAPTISARARSRL